MNFIYYALLLLIYGFCFNVLANESAYSAQIERPSRHSLQQQEQHSHRQSRRDSWQNERQDRRLQREWRREQRLDNKPEKQATDQFEQESRQAYQQ